MLALRVNEGRTSDDAILSALVQGLAIVLLCVVAPVFLPSASLLGVYSRGQA